MKQLKQQFTGIGEVRGFEFNQLKASSYAYIYEVINKGVGETNNSVSDHPEDWTTHYEVFEHKENNHHDCVSYPGANSFGMWAKTTTDRDEAEHYFNLFEQDVKRRNHEMENSAI